MTNQQRSKTTACIVVYDDEMGICSPYGLDPDCEGGLIGDEPVAVFPNRRAAQRAIRISKNRERLRESQGQTVNTDFTEYSKHLKIVPVVYVDDSTEESS